MKNKYLLPNGHLSHSAIELWFKSPDRYRKQYYMGEGSFSSEATRFGSKIHGLLEKNHSSVSHLPRYDTPELRLDVEIDGVPILAFIDTYDSLTHSFRDYKTGKVNWDKVKVRKTSQLPFYALLLEKKYCVPVEDSGIIWIGTKKTEDKKVGIGTVKGGLKLTGEWEEFERVIKPNEKAIQHKRIIQAAKEITKDYKSWIKENI